MNFTSVVFIFIFLPIVLALLWLLKKLHAGENIISAYVLLVSLVFFAWGGVGNLLVILVLSIVNYFLARRIDGGQSRSGQNCDGQNHSGQRRKLWMILGIALNLLVLLGYKYTEFAVNSIRSLLSLEKISLSIPAAPLGLSFFTFLSVAYLADVYQGKVPPLRNVVKYLEYVFFFPKVTMGPITRLGAVNDDLMHHRITLSNAYDGVMRFCMGFAKKVLLANHMALVADAVFAAGAQAAAPYAWIGIVSYSLQIYLDFSAYSDMAIGLGQVFGISILENFNYPYISRSIKEFWRRWHISLSSWFRDYVYIPLGGSRQGTLKTYRNLMIVFFLTGLWHGASWNFIVWGLFFGVFLLLERLGWGKVLERLPVVLQRIYTLLVVMIGWVFFRADSLGAALQYIGCMFGMSQGSLKNLDIVKELTPQYFLLLAVSLLACMPLLKVIAGWVEKLSRGRALLPGLRDVVVLLLFFLALCYMVASSYNPFIYTRF